jgi:hypothetical protein
MVLQEFSEGLERTKKGTELGYVDFNDRDVLSVAKQVSNLNDCLAAFNGRWSDARDAGGKPDSCRV